MILSNSGVATGGMGGSGPPTCVQTPPEISANPLKSFLHILGGNPTHVCIILQLLLLTSKEKWFGPPTFFGLATPLVSNPCLRLLCKKSILTSEILRIGKMNSTFHTTILLIISKVLSSYYFNGMKSNEK